MGSLEASVLYAVALNSDDAYGVSIADTILERCGEKVALGAIYSTLDRLERKGFLRSWWSEPTTERGGRRKRLFQITSDGESSLRSFDRQFRGLSDSWQVALGECK